MKKLLLTPFLLLLSIASVSAATLVVQVRSDLRPYRDFSLIRTDVYTSTGRYNNVRGRFVMRREKRARASRNWGRGVRVAEISNLSNETYHLVVSAIDRRNRTVVSRPVRLKLKDGVYVVTVLLTHPNPAARDRTSNNQCFIAFQKARQQCRVSYNRCKNAARGNKPRINACYRLWKTTCEKQALDNRVQCDIRRRKARRGMRQDINTRGAGGNRMEIRK